MGFKVGRISAVISKCISKCMSFCSRLLLCSVWQLSSHFTGRDVFGLHRNLEKLCTLTKADNIKLHLALYI